MLRNFTRALARVKLRYIVHYQITFRGTMFWLDNLIVTWSYLNQTKYLFLLVGSIEICTGDVIHFWTTVEQPITKRYFIYECDNALCKTRYSVRIQNFRFLKLVNLFARSLTGPNSLNVKMENSFVYVMKTDIRRYSIFIVIDLVL